MTRRRRGHGDRRPGGAAAASGGRLSRGGSPSPAGRPPSGAFRPRFFIDGPTSGLEEAQLRAGGGAGARVRLGPEDARHVRTVLRAGAGDPAEVVLEPWRLLVPAEVDTVGPEVILRVLSAAEAAAGPAGGPAEAESAAEWARPQAAEAAPAETLLVALVQGVPQPSAVDVIVEKGTEVGVDLFVLVPVQGSPPLPVARLRGRLERWRRVANDAAKQSKQLARPAVRVVESLEAAARTLAAAAEQQGGASLGLPGPAAVRAVALEPSAPATLRQLLEGGPDGLAAARLLATPPATMSPGGPQTAAGARPARDLLVLWVGPESGWTAEELAWFERAGIPLARLGRRILKAETAGPVAVALVRFSWGIGSIIRP